MNKSVCNHRRSWRNFLAYPNFQYRLALVQIVFVGLVAAVLFLTLILPGYGKPITPDNTLVQYAVAQMVLQVFDRVAVAMAAIMVVSALYHLFFSHRLCGPLINMGTPLTFWLRVKPLERSSCVARIY